MEQPVKGLNKEEIEQKMREAVGFHLGGLKLEGLEIPQPTASSAYIEVAA